MSIIRPGTRFFQKNKKIDTTQQTRHKVFANECRIRDNHLAVLCLETDAHRGTVVRSGEPDSQPRRHLFVIVKQQEPLRRVVHEVLQNRRRDDIGWVVMRVRMISSAEKELPARSKYANSCVQKVWYATNRVGL